MYDAYGTAVRGLHRHVRFAPPCAVCTAVSGLHRRKRFAPPSRRVRFAPPCAVCTAVCGLHRSLHALERSHTSPRLSNRARIAAGTVAYLTLHASSRLYSVGVQDQQTTGIGHRAAAAAAAAACAAASAVAASAAAGRRGWLRLAARRELLVSHSREVSGRGARGGDARTCLRALRRGGAGARDGRASCQDVGR